MEEKNTSRSVDSKNTNRSSLFNYKQVELADTFSTSVKYNSFELCEELKLAYVAKLEENARYSDQFLFAACYRYYGVQVYVRMRTLIVEVFTTDPVPPHISNDFVSTLTINKEEGGTY